jgi:hypothetical protein
MAMGRKSAKGYTWNPLMKIGRNTKPCICGKDVKFKNCCLKVMPSVLKEEQVKALFKDKK